MKMNGYRRDQRRFLNRRSQSTVQVKRLDNYADIQNTVNDDVPYIGLYRDKNTLLLNANVGGNFVPNSYNVFANFNEWFRQQ